MPTYSYKCLPEEHLFEARQKFSDDPLTECPECGGAVRRVINSVGIVFKGKGFYVTDNRSSNGKNGASKASGESKSDDKKAESSSESKAETKSESKSAESTKSESKEKPKAKEKK